MGPNVRSHLRSSHHSRAAQDKVLRASATPAPEALAEANGRHRQPGVPPGTFAVGPTPDDSIFRQASRTGASDGQLLCCRVRPRLALLGRGGHTCQWLLVQTDAQFASSAGSIFPNYTVAAGMGACVEAAYPSPSSRGSSRYGSQSARARGLPCVTVPSLATCHHLTETLAGSCRRVWSMRYAVPPGYHAVDIAPTFKKPRRRPWIARGAARAAAPARGSAFLGGVSSGLQSYFMSDVATGDPNARRMVPNQRQAMQWTQPNVGVGKVSVGDSGFGTIEDGEQLTSASDFWRAVAAADTSLGGHAPLVP